MRLKSVLYRTVPLVALLAAASCAVDLDKFVFDDDAFDALSGSGGDKSSSGGSDMGGSGSGGELMNLGGDTGTGTVSECSETGELVCDGKQVQVCGGFDYINVGSECEFVCSDGACGGVCVPGDTQCASDLQQVACGTSGEWGEASTCNNACVGDKCGGVCKPGARGCDPITGNKRLCDTSGQWQDEGDCGAGVCDESTGVCKGCAGTTATQCAGDGYTIEKCDGSEFQYESTCPYVCVADGSGGAKCDGECRPARDAQAAQQQCVSSPTGVQSCASDGKWGAVTPCSYICDQNGETAACGGECVPGSSDCSGSVIRNCSEKGVWETGKDCAAGGDVCAVIDGAAECTMCQPGAKRCAILYPQTCNASGSAWVSAKSACAELCYGGTCYDKERVPCGFGKLPTRGCTAPNTAWTCTTTLGTPTFNTTTCAKDNLCALNACGTTL